MAKYISWNGQEIIVEYAKKDSHGQTIDIEALNSRISNLEGKGRFLSLWNAETGVATTNPPQSPYEYRTGDYFIVAQSGNKIPNGSSYVIGGTNYVESQSTFGVGNFFVYDGTYWQYQTAPSVAAVIDIQISDQSIVNAGIANIRGIALNFGQGKSEYVDAHITGQIAYDNWIANYGSLYILVDGEYVLSTEYQSGVTYYWLRYNSYYQNDLCYYQGNLMKCVSESTSSETYNSSDWVQTTIADEIESVFGKRIPSFTSTTITKAQAEQLIKGGYMTSYVSLTGTTNPVVFLPGTHTGGGNNPDYYHGIAISSGRGYKSGGDIGSMIFPYYASISDTGTLYMGNPLNPNSIELLGIKIINKNPNGYGLLLPETNAPFSAWTANRTVATTEDLKGTLSPKTAATYDIGTATYTYKNIYLRETGMLYFYSAQSVFTRIEGHSGYLTLLAATATSIAQIHLDANTHSLYPSADSLDYNGTHDLGRYHNPWNDVWFTGAMKTNANEDYGVKLPNTTSYTADKTLATTGDFNDVLNEASASVELGSVSALNGKIKFEDQDFNGRILLVTYMHPTLDFDCTFTIFVTSSTRYHFSGLAMYQNIQASDKMYRAVLEHNTNDDSYDLYIEDMYSSSTITSGIVTYRVMNPKYFA